MRVVREDAPWCPDNIEFIRRINGLDDADAVKDIVFDASYLVMGLGDVYLGAPRGDAPRSPPSARDDEVQPGAHLDGGKLRRHRRFLPVHLRHGRTGRLPVRGQDPAGLEPAPDRFCVRPALAVCVRSTRSGSTRSTPKPCARCVKRSRGVNWSWIIRSSRFDYGGYLRFLDAEAGEIKAFTEQRKRAFDTELAGWRERGLLTFETSHADGVAQQNEARVAPGATVVTSPMAGSIWSVRDSETVSRDDVLVVVEAMKSEFEIRAPVAGKVVPLRIERPDGCAGTKARSDRAGMKATRGGDWMDLSVAGLAQAYGTGVVTPDEVLAHVREAIRRRRGPLRVDTPAGRSRTGALSRTARNARSGCPSPVGRALRDQGQHRPRRLSDDGGMSRLRVRAGGVRDRGGAAAGGRRSSPRQDESRPVRDRPGWDTFPLRRDAPTPSIPTTLPAAAAAGRR